ncbi:cytochrome P450 [Sphingomonas sp. MG17]|uniref:Cytochrome P450 n=1 Tax=Sphingomonas tagetis TaxID=2949092 RepID=A0A9X2HJL0_9SPHN|nr:cytochrome P450 [Sphingomonas tagetis]MCP3731267.1 cytochrome P450 [Sphingomonas tagetis]
MADATAAVRAPVPDHVPAALVLDFDGYRPGVPENGTYHEPYARLYEESVPAIFWSPYNRGHWIITRRDYLAEAFGDPSRFTSTEGAAVDPIEPPDRPRLAPIETDPPRQQLFRKLFSPAFVATALKAREAEARQLAIDLVEGFKPKGRCEFVTEFAQHLPIRIFMNMVDLPEEDRLVLLPLAAAQVQVDAPKHETMAKLFEYAGRRVAERAKAPGDDLISKIATAQIEGRPIEMHEAVGVTALLLIGGLDTVASMMSHIMLFLATNPDHRHAIVADPGIVPGATEEFLRRFALTNPGRTVVADMDFHGIRMRAGDKVMLATPFGALDPRDYADPLKVDFTRKSNTKTTFGAGPHVCPGSMLARVEIKVLLEEWLPRIPDFSLDPDDAPRTRTGVNGSVEHLPLVWKA